MADNVTVTPGTGTTIAADDISGVLFQRVKVVHGADGTATDASAAAPLPVTVAALPAGTNNIGDVDVLTLPALPAGTNNIGDVDVLTLPALPAGTNTIGATFDAGFAITVSRGVSNAAVTSADASAGVNITAVPTSGQKLVIVDLVMSVNVDMEVALKEETTGTVFYNFYLKAGAVLQFTPRSKFKLVSVDKRLVMDTTVAGAISCTASYYSEA